MHVGIEQMVGERIQCCSKVPSFSARNSYSSYSMVDSAIAPSMLRGPESMPYSLFLSPPPQRNNLSPLAKSLGVPEVTRPRLSGGGHLRATTEEMSPVSLSSSRRERNGGELFGGGSSPTTSEVVGDFLPVVVVGDLPAFLSSTEKERNRGDLLSDGLS
ncbi:hypothetical protein CRG98_035475 [Punica granatum]|uniref:Uncharacterized protein n=1 Tax=Punica granatum TaxID=22663 RepID=A0A2I0IJC8_PUNGR|nr:hypothetical protein CRG98_035475 [Punica granatum]